MKNVSELQKLIKEIEDVRIELNKLIAEEEEALIGPEIVKLSEFLDQLLFKYYNLK